MKISKAHKKTVAAIFARDLVVTVHSLDGQFRPEPTTKDVAHKELYASRSTYLSRSDDHRGTERYVVRVHSNLWFEMRPAPEHPACCGCADCETRYAA